MMHLSKNEFPEPDALVTNQNPNGFNIYYLDWAGNPQVIFMIGNFWDKVKGDFEDRINHSLIVAHKPARMTYDY